jgi:hypothetical protein
VGSGAGTDRRAAGWGCAVVAVASGGAAVAVCDLSGGETAAVWVGAGAEPLAAAAFAGGTRGDFPGPGDGRVAPGDRRSVGPDTVHGVTRGCSQRGAGQLSGVPGGSGGGWEHASPQGRQARPVSAAAGGRRSQARAALVATADRELAGLGVSRRRGDASVARDDLPVAVRAVPGCAAHRTDSRPADASQRSPSRRQAGPQRPEPHPCDGQHQ